MRAFTFCIGYHTIHGEHVYLALESVGAIPFSYCINEREVRNAYIGVLIDGIYKERAVSFEHAMRLASLLDSKTR